MARRLFRIMLILTPLVAFGLLVIDVLVPQRQQAFDDEYRLLFALSAVCSVPTLGVHWLFCPHPKFRLLPRRLFCIRTHIVAGTIEFAAGIIAWYWLPCPLASRCMAGTALLLHVPTAAFQTSIVFGSRLLMIPAYVLCILLHAYCAFRLWWEPASEFWLIQTFLTFSVYAWVRVFYYANCRWGFFGTWTYSAAVLGAGLLIGPAVLGPLALPVLISFIAGYVLLYWLVERPSPTEMREELMERRRDWYVSERLCSVWREIRNAAAQRENDSQPTEASRQRMLFDELDVNGNGVLNATDLGAVLCANGASRRMVEQIVGEIGQRELTLEVFVDRIWNLFEHRICCGGVLHRLDGLKCVGKAGRSPVEQATTVFQRLDLDGSGYITRFELWTLLTEWGLPDRDVDECVRKRGDSQGRINQQEFFHKLRPVWEFAYDDVIARPLTSAVGP